MRLAVRWLAFIIPALILYLYLSDSILTAGNGTAKPLRPVALPPQSEIHAQLVSDIGSFWRKWANIMWRARPGIRPISITSQAATAKPPHPDQPRTPYRNLVRNDAMDIEMLRQAHLELVKELEWRDGNGDNEIFSGRGVVMVGGGEYFGPAIIGIQMLRRTGSTLPVEVFVPNNAEYEPEVCENYLPKLNARCVVLTHFQSPVPEQDGAGMEIKHYQLKAPALLLSSFEEVLMLDSDSIPLLDPETYIFLSEPYLSTGFVNWPDFWAATESPTFWEVAGLEKFPENLSPFASESGQIVINKRTHLPTLLLATYYNLFGDQHFYPLLSQGALGQGDKETFMAAAVALNSTYYRVKTPASSVGRHDGNTLKGTAIIQHLPYDDMNQAATVRPMFLHSNTPKMNAGHLVDEGDLTSKNGMRLRLLGSKEDSVAKFGLDIEAALWELLVQTGCELAGVIREWKDRLNMCERLNEHYLAVFKQENSSEAESP
ncbi:mannosyltransferase putative-domain-containing protein [Xylariales sp. PMI_506]|nr:mannosyltransferase putative-domain-containing protein [Xylariales sp. PMI_506]